MSSQDPRSRFYGAQTFTREVGAQAPREGRQPGVHMAAKGAPVTLFRPRFTEPGEATGLHRVGAGDRLDLIAHRYFSNPRLFFRVADQNECLEAEELLEPGRTLKIGKGG